MAKFRKKIRKPRLRAFILLFLLLIAIFSIAYGGWYLLPGTKYVHSDQLPHLVINHMGIHENKFHEDDQMLFVRLDVVKEFIDPTIHWAPEADRIIVTTENKMIEMNTAQLEAFVNDEPVALSAPFTVIDGEPFIPLDFLAVFYPVQIVTLPNGVTTLDDRSIPHLKGQSLTTAFLREKPSLRAPRIEAMTVDSPVIIYEEIDGWYFVRNALGRLGYIQKKHIHIVEIQRSTEQTPSHKPAWKPLGERISLTWDYFSRARYDMSSYEEIPGLHVISPTWFHLADETGSITSYASDAYMDWAHSQELKVWALFSNTFDPALTSTLLRNADYRKNAILQILLLASMYNLDGINIDFENMYYEDKDYFTQFLRELTPFLREQGLTVSVDVTVRSSSPNWSMVYDREAIAEIVDYIAVMAYDEHWAASPIAGSVASLPWVERGINGLLEQVPKEKLLLGIPFYTRLWEETVESDGSIQVSSRALSMTQAERLIQENRAELRFDATAQQNYAEYEKDGNKYRIWLEDEDSLKRRLALVHKYDLAGIASWRKGFEKPEIWTILKEAL